MKVFFKKFKKAHIVKKIFYLLTTILYAASLVYFIQGVLQLKGIENVLRIIAITFFIIWGLIYLLGGLLSMLSKKKKGFIFLTIFTLLFCPVFTVSSYYINKIYGSLNNMVKNELLYTTNMIALKDTQFKSASVIGMIESKDDIEGNQLAKKLIKKNGLTNKIKYYEDYQSMILALYKGDIDACFVSSNYAIIFKNEKFESEEGEEEIPIADRVKVIYEYSEELKNKDTEVLNTDKKKSLTEPFTVLIMGVDSDIDGLKANQAFNGDTLIMVTFNPNTLTATMFSIPRDMYVPIACNHNRYNKINSSAAYGSSCVINTVKQLTGINIDYYVKMNFIGVVQLVEALGGVTVDVEEPDFYYDEAHKGQVCEQNSHRQFGNQLVCMNPGIQTLNGEQALAYARCRHLYAISDIARNQHQQQIIEAMAQKLKTIRSIEDFEKILNAVSNNLETNMTPEQIMSFYDVGKDMLLSSNVNSTALSIKKTYLAYYSLPIYIPGADRYTSALGYYPGSLNAITTLMKENLGLAKPKTIKTFKVSYNENYTTPLVGYGITTGEKLQRMPNLQGQDEYYVQNWCATNGITCEFKEITHAAPKGTITYQEVHEGVLLKPIKYALFDVSNGKGAKEEPDKEKDEEDKDKENNKEENKDKENTGDDKEETETPKEEDKTEPTTPETPKEEDKTEPTPETPKEEPTTPSQEEKEEQ